MAKLFFCRYLDVVGNVNVSAKGALGSTLQKFCLEYVLCKTKQKGQVRFFNDIKNFAKRCVCFCIILRLLKGCVYRLKGKTLRKICTTQAHLHRCTLLQLPIDKNTLCEQFFSLRNNFFATVHCLLCSKTKSKNCTFIPSYAKNAVVTFIGSFAKGRQKDAVAL